MSVKTRTRLWLCSVSLFAAVGAIWFLVQPKPGAAWGKLNFWQFYLALVAALLGGVTLVLGLVPSKQRRPTLFRTLAAGMALMLSLLAIEGVLWTFPTKHLMENPWYAQDERVIQASDRLPWVRPPHFHWQGPSRGDIARLSGDPDPWARTVTFQTDHQGFRNSTDLHHADLVFLGDSFTEAGNVLEEETFVQLTARRLSLTARNLGRSGYTGPTELIVLRDFALACQPRVIVWQVCEANDLDEALMYQEWMQQGRPKDFFLQHDPHHTRVEAWKQRSPSYWLFKQFRTSGWEFAGIFQPNSPNATPVYFLRKFGTGQSPAEHPGWAPLSDSLREADELADQEKIPWIVLYIPMKIRVLADFVAFNEWTRRESANWGYPRSVLEDYVRQLCQELEVPFVSATPALRQAASQGRLVYLPMDTHLSPEGHRVVSDLLLPAIKQVLE